jgi:hypothetical protein
LCARRRSRGLGGLRGERIVRTCFAVRGLHRRPSLGRGKSRVHLQLECCVRVIWVRKSSSRRKLSRERLRRSRIRRGSCRVVISEIVSSVNLRKKAARAQRARGAWRAGAKLFFFCVRRSDRRAKSSGPVLGRGLTGWVVWWCCGGTGLRLRRRAFRGASSATGNWL